MSDALAIITQALHNDVDTMRALAQNVANSQSTGYRRAVPVQHAFAGLVSQEVDSVTRASSAAPLVHQSIDSTAGSLRPASGALNVALEGEGYFVVQTEQGEALTRRGDWRIDATGFLTTHTGQRVLGRLGAVHVEAGALLIGANGAVSVDGKAIDALRVVRVEGKVLPIGNDLYHAEPAGVLHDAPAAIVRQGFLEGSNVEAVNEMTRAVEALRHFEASQRYFRAYDDLTRQAISELGKN